MPDDTFELFTYCLFGLYIIIILVWRNEDSIKETSVFLKTSVIVWIRLYLEMCKNIYIALTRKRNKIVKLKTLSSPTTPLGIPQRFTDPSLIQNFSELRREVYLNSSEGKSMRERRLEAHNLYFPNITIDEYFHNKNNIGKFCAQCHTANCDKRIPCNNIPSQSQAAFKDNRGDSKN